jgi:hypothetical protein
MEQYIHTLIAADAEFTPQPQQVAEFFEALNTAFSFRVISNTQWQPGFRVMKPGTRTRTAKNVFTGETRTIPVPDHFVIEKTSEIPPLIENLKEYRVAASGEWPSNAAPLQLLKADKTPFEENLICDVSCNIRPAPVSTSAWDVESGPNFRNVPPFGSPWNDESTIGVFPNPWTGAAIEVPNAGSARFWIEFEFGKFIYPRVDKSFDVLSPPLVQKAEEYFATRFVQGCRFW